MQDRLTAKRLFVTGTGTGPQIADRLGLRYGTLKRWSLAERWVDLRREHMAAQDAQQLRLPPTEPELVPPTAPAVPTDELGEQQRVVAVQIVRLDGLIADCMDASELVRLVQAKASLYGLLHARPAPVRSRGRAAPRLWASPVPDPELGPVPVP
jgi:hypothetical protein